MLRSSIIAIIVAALAATAVSQTATPQPEKIAIVGATLIDVSGYGRSTNYASIPWKRFWCRREDMFSLGDRGFFVRPRRSARKASESQPHHLRPIADDPCLILLGEPGVGKSWSLKPDVDAYLQQTSGASAIEPRGRRRNWLCATTD